jgi:uncharacterized protein
MTSHVLQRPAWGFFATLGWTLLALAAAMGVGIILGKIFAIDWLAPEGSYGRTPTSLTMMAGYAALVGVIIVAARSGGANAGEYLGLVKPKGRYLLIGSACVVLPAFVTFAHALHFDVNELFRTNGYHRATGVGVVVHFVLVAIAAPIMEELLFRGFMYRGLSTSRIGVAGAIAVTSVLWMVLHGGRGLEGNIDLVICGIALGVTRHLTGSTLVTIACHIANNAIISLVILAGIYWAA